MKPRNIASLYPVLFAVSPVLSLYAANIDRVSLTELARTLAVALAASLALLAVARATLRDGAKAGVYVSVFLLVFFSYQTVMDAAARKMVLGVVVGRHRYVYAAYVLFLASLFVLTARSRRDFSLARQFFAVMAVVMMVTPSVRIVHGALTTLPVDRGKARWAETAAAEQARARRVAAAAPTARPDIYYIILDCYLREDVLKDHYGYDNGEFIDSFRDMGFHVADRSFSNYPCTYMSLASSLNYEYLHTLRSAVGRKLDTGMLRHLIADNRINRALRELGYELVFFPSGWDVTADSRFADHFMSQTRANLSQFEQMLMERSMLKIITVGTREQRTRVLRTFEMLAQVPRNEKPTFTFAHIVSPHPPYVFDSSGDLPQLASVPEKELDDEVEAKLYLGQLEYVTKLAEAAVREILRQSPDAVIILQSDHGIFLGHIDPRAASDTPWRDLPDQSKRTFARCAAGILNAYRIPGAEAALRDDISPVNTFRILMNELFGADYDLLPDRTFVHGKSRSRAPESLSELVEWREDN